MNMRTQANFGRRLLGAAAVAAFASAVLSGCVLAPVVSTVLEPEDEPSSSIPAQETSTPAMDRAQPPTPSVKAEIDDPDRAKPPAGAPQDADADEDESAQSRDNSIFGPPRSSPPAPRVTVRIELPHES